MANEMHIIILQQMCLVCLLFNCSFLSLVMELPLESSCKVDTEKDCGTNVYSNHDHSMKCREQMVLFWRKSQFCDINLVIVNVHGTPTACVAAHKVVLASAIPFFAMMFAVKMKEDESKELSLHGYESTAVKALVEYAYTGKLEISESSVKDIYVTAKRFTLPGIESFCIAFMQREMGPSNCIGISSFSETQGLTDVLKNANDYIIQNFTLVSKESEFLDLTVEKLSEFIKRDDITVDMEEDVYYAVTRWIQHDEDSRSQYVDDLYDYVRFPVTSERFLETVASKNALLTTSERGKVYLKDGFKYHADPAAVIFSNPSKTHPRQSIEGIICVVGGESDSSTSLKSFTLFNHHDGDWFEGPTMNYSRSRLAVAIIQGELYAVGGYDQGYSLALCEKYSATENAWKEIASLNNARSNLAVVPMGKSLFAIGGYTGSVHLQSVEVYNPSTDEWTTGPPLQEPRSELSALYSDQYIYAIGGCNSKGDLRSVERFDLMNRKWEFISSMNSPRTGGGW